MGNGLFHIFHMLWSPVDSKWAHLIKTKLIIASYHPENPVNPLIIEKIFFSSCEVINMHRLHATKTMLDQSGIQGLLDP